MVIFTASAFVALGYMHVNSYVISGRSIMHNVALFSSFDVIIFLFMKFFV
jgi:hypothetical protein